MNMRGGNDDEPRVVCLMEKLCVEDWYEKVSEREVGSSAGAILSRRGATGSDTAEKTGRLNAFLGIWNGAVVRSSTPLRECTSPE